MLRCVVSMFSRVLFAGWRVGDVTDWYQSIEVAAMGLYGPRKAANRGGITSVEHRLAKRIFEK